MAKLFLKFEDAMLKEFPLSQGVVTIGRLPDNSVQIDNLAVSGHHAKVFFEGGHYVLEDNNSLNGTYVNNHRITKAILKHGDQVLIGKHTLLFQEEVQKPAEVTQRMVRPTPPVPTLESTVVLDTRKAKEMMAAPHEAAAPALAREHIAMLTVMAGRTDQPQYVLSSKLNVIGKSEMASIKLKGWFKPKVAAVINHREGKYYIAPSEKHVKVKINDEVIGGQHLLTEGDIIEVAGVKMTFAYAE